MTINKVHDQYEIIDTFQNNEIRGSYTVDSNGKRTIYIDTGELKANYSEIGGNISTWGNDPALIDFSRYFINLVENVLNYDSE